MANKTGRKPILIIESYPYSNIIFLVASGFNYPKSIAEKRNVAVFPTTRQLKTLESKKFLISLNKTKDKNFPQNKKMYVVNWDKIIEEFIKYASNKFESSSEGMKKWRKKINNNEFIKFIIKNAFELKGDYQERKNIKELFEELKRGGLCSKNHFCTGCMAYKKGVYDLELMLKVYKKGKQEGYNQAIQDYSEGEK